MILFRERRSLRNGRWDPQTILPKSKKAQDRFLNTIAECRKLVSRYPVAFHMTDKYMQYDEVSNRAWDELVPVKNGLISIEDPYRFDLEPGHADGENENVAWFGVSVFHQLHCLSAIRDTIRALNTDQPARPWGGPDHLEHCLDYIRQGLMCAADTAIEWPVFVKEGFGSDGPITGEGIEHQCRDWDTGYDFGVRNGALKAFNWAKN